MVVAAHESLDEADVLGHFLLDLLGPVLFFVVIRPVNVLVRYLQIFIILLLLILLVLNIEADLFLIHIFVWDRAAITGILRK